jgi:steroid delta-isomerase-like uncharacterized protein
MVGCQDKEAMAELEAMKAQAALEEENKALVMRYFEAWGKGDFETLEALQAPDFAFYYPSISPNPVPKEDLKPMGEMLRNAFPDISFSMEEICADGDRVIFRFIQRGTHEGEYMGIPATGSKIECSGFLMSRFENGKVVEQREDFDELGLWMQLGYELKPKEED